MTFPTGTTIDTTNLDSAEDDPSLAREDLYDLAVAVNAIIASANTANGVLVLGSGGKISANYIPTTVNITGDLNLTPTTGIVKIQSLLRLPPQFTADIEDDFDSPELGDIVSTYDGDDGDPCLAMFDGTAWKRITLGSEISNS